MIMSQINSVVAPRSFSRSVKAPRKFMTQEEADKLGTTAACIRECKKRHADATNGEIARFLGIRPQWVFNVLNNPPKTK
jgi:hypothetical protein